MSKQKLRYGYDRKDADKATSAMAPAPDEREDADPEIDDAGDNSVDNEIDDTVEEVPEAVFIAPVSSPPGIPVDNEEAAEGDQGIELAPRDGVRIELLNEETGEYVQSYWRRTRQCIGGRWVPNGEWTRVLGNSQISFIPRYWRHI